MTGRTAFIDGLLDEALRLGLPKGLFPVVLPLQILKALLPSSILATCSGHLNLLDLITLTILGERPAVLALKIINIRLTGPLMVIMLNCD